MPETTILSAVPSTPDATTVTQTATLVRAIMMLSSGVTGALGIAMPHISDSDLNAYVTAGLIVWSAASFTGTVIWGWWKNNRKAQEAHAANVATAEATARATMAAGAPTPVPVDVAPVAVQASPVPPVPVAVPAAALVSSAPPVPVPAACALEEIKPSQGA